MPLNSTKILLYGANGFTGQLTANCIAADESLLWFRSRIILAGRTAAKIEPIGERTQLPWRVFPLDDPQQLNQALSDIGLVLHMAGPFAQTAEPMLRGCIRNQCHYMDISGEISVFQLIFEQLATEISNAGILVIPSVGFDVVPTDCLAAKLAHELPDATHLDLAMCHSNVAVTAGTVTSAIEAISDCNTVFGARINGKMINVPPGYCSRYVDFPCMGRKYTAFLPWGDCYTAYISTKIPNIHVFLPTIWPLDIFTKYGSYALKLALKIPIVKSTMISLVRTTVKGPSPQHSATGSVDVWGEARNEMTGKRVTASMIVPEGYKFTGYAALESAKCVIEGNCKITKGVATPSLAFGYEYVAKIPGVFIGELQIHLPHNE